MEVYIRVKDDWGKEDWKNKVQCGRYFDYNFSPADVATIKKEMVVILENMKTAIKNTPPHAITSRMDSEKRCT